MISEDECIADLMFDSRTLAGKAVVVVRRSVWRSASTHDVLRKHSFRST